MLRDPLQSGGNSGRRGGPHQEHGLDAVDASLKSLRKSEISASHLDSWWETSRAWVARQRTDLRAGSRYSRENLAANGAGPSDNKNMIHGGPSILRASV